MTTTPIDLAATPNEEAVSTERKGEVAHSPAPEDVRHPITSCTVKSFSTFARLFATGPAGERWQLMLELGRWEAESMATAVTGRGYVTTKHWRLL